MSDPCTGPFVGRDRELDLLDKRLNETRRGGAGTLLAIRGRRRVGKSRLIEEFAHRAQIPYVFFTAVQQPVENELVRFTQAMAESDIPSAGAVRTGTHPTNWEAALEQAAEGATRDRPLLIVIDELPYLIGQEPSIEAVLQKVWDRTLQRSPVMLVVIGSDEAMMDALNDVGRPLYDRARPLVIHPLNPAGIKNLLEVEPANALDAYTVIGGFPVLALELMRSGKGLLEYVEDSLCDPTSFLVISAERVMTAELPPEARARKVLGAIGKGITSYSKISSTSELAGGALDRALDVLQHKRIVTRVSPYSKQTPSSNRRYQIVDPYMRFWLQFVYQRIDDIERGQGSRAIADFKTKWLTFRGRAIEPIVKSSVERLLGDQERFGDAKFVGGFWNRNSTIEVDIVGGDRLPAARKVSFIGSIKWREQSPFDAGDANSLMNQRSEVPGAQDAKLLGVSNVGFSDKGVLDVRIEPADLISAWD